MKKNLFLLPLLTVAAPLAAQTVAAPSATIIMAPPPIAQTPQHLALADDLVEAAQVRRTQMAAIPQVVDLVMPMMMRGNEAHADQVRTILTEELNRAFLTKSAVLVKISRDAFARNFTDAELSDLAVFYRSPTGKRFVELQPVVMGESMRAGADIGRQAAQEALPFVIERLRKANLKVPERI